MSLTHDTTQRTLAQAPRHDWTRAEIAALFALPFPELMFEAQRVHRLHFDPAEVNVEAAAARLRGRPVLFVANSEDVRMPKEIAFDLKAAVGPGAEVLIVPGRSHGGAWRDGTAAYEAAATVVLQAAGRSAAAPAVAAAP